MSDTDDEEAKLLGQKPPRSAWRSFVSFIVVVMVIVIAGVGAILFWPPLRDVVLPVTNMASPSAAKLGDLERKVQVLSARVDELSSKVDTIGTAPTAAASTNSAAPANAASSDVAHMQNELSALSTTLSGLQADMKQAGSAVADMHNQAEMSVAKTVAFIQLREAALSGRGFAPELAAMQTATKADTAFDPMLTKLGPYAEKGADSIATLRDQLAGHGVAIDHAIAAAAAQNWWQRIVAEFKTLISIRPLHSNGTPDSILENMQDDLARGEVTAALTEINNLPIDAQNVLAEWRKQAEARQDINAAIHALADQLISVGHTAPGRDTP